jgi:hypothetical protein
MLVLIPAQPIVIGRNEPPNDRLILGGDEMAI